MDEQEILTALRELFPRAEVTEAMNAFFWFAEGDERKLMPFLTLVTTDEHDRASQLSREGVYRLNFSLTPAEYASRFGPLPRARADWSVVDTGFDYDAQDRLMPHPIYAPLGWACIVNPGRESFEALVPLLQAAYERALT